MWHFTSKKNISPAIGDFLKPTQGSTLEGIKAAEYVMMQSSEKCHGCGGKGWVAVIEKPFKCPVCEGSGIKPQDFHYHPPVVVQNPPLVGHGYGEFPKSDIKFPEYKTDFKENENE